jgi:hypothetical protein
MEARGDRYKWFLDEWNKWKYAGDRALPLPQGWDKSIDHWLGAGLPQAALLACIDIAMEKDGVNPWSVFAYMGGVARKKIEALHEAAAEIMKAEAPDLPDDPGRHGHPAVCDCATCHARYGHLSEGDGDGA